MSEDRCASRRYEPFIEKSMRTRFFPDSEENPPPTPELQPAEIRQLARRALVRQRTALTGDTPAEELWVTRYARTQLRFHEAESGEIAIDGAGGVQYRLNPTAGYVWRKLDGSESLADIARVMAAEFGTDEKTIRDDLCELLPELRREGLIA